jgi:hypothetical protein
MRLEDFETEISFEEFESRVLAKIEEENWTQITPDDTYKILDSPILTRLNPMLFKKWKSEGRIIEIRRTKSRRKERHRNDIPLYEITGNGGDKDEWRKKNGIEFQLKSFSLNKHDKRNHENRTE